MKQNEIQYPRHLSCSLEKPLSFDGNDADIQDKEFRCLTLESTCLVSTDFKKMVGTTTVKWVCEETYTAIRGFNPLATHGIR